VNIGNVICYDGSLHQTIYMKNKMEQHAGSPINKHWHLWRHHHTPD